MFQNMYQKMIELRVKTADKGLSPRACFLTKPILFLIVK